ncbi:ABC transporter substrate-binding protein [Paracoccus siganidrum]|uniref:ABC transporter substrate-binding protein n=1 Tax=Paracoccus siganidrum TaxID=1276757 RepID=A0A419A5V3_9RHOB|nr:ABC transporter substrate-binding protein [Paracoccus siganidrum]RJL12563.1 ABC transporter substrate-binding protein [Paracoccus siganidrum]RMC37087.1 ABC transporter substrate-binding protein [Paracoccus siganidrum]
MFNRLTATLLASTMLAGAAWAETTVTAVMHSGLRVLDPIMTTAHITRNHAYMIYDVLIAQDSDFQPQPQMADWEVSEDQQTYTFTLRDGLVFHDGEPVTAADAVASLQRWAQNDAGGQVVMDRTESLEATDDKTITWVLKEPFAPMLDVLSKQSALPPFIMPARVAETPADEAITDYTGSGPFIFVQEEFQPGISVTYAKNPDYVPRDEPADWMAGGKVVNVDQVKWVNMPDIQTAVNALSGGEIDYIEQMQVDLVPLLEGDPNVAVEVREPTGMQTMVRTNFLHPPFDDPKIRQAALKAISQEPVLAAMIGNPEFYQICGAVLGCGTPLGSETGAETLVQGGGADEARALLEEAGYDGTPVVLMAPTDMVALATQPVVVSQALREVGFTVDMQPMDWQTLVTRRASQGAPADGGWNIFITNWMVPEISNPISNPMLNGRGDDAWFGWPTDETIEALKEEYIAAADADAQKEVAEKIQAHTLENVLLVPLGQYTLPQARRTAITDMIDSPVPVFWNMQKAE